MKFRFNIKGLVSALPSSLFIGSSFIIKKKGLKKAGVSGIRAGSGGYSYLYEPLWWVGMITMVVGEVANFVMHLHRYSGHSSWLCSMCCGVDDNRFTCSSRTCN